jgi:hypothetical protein
MVVKTTSNIDFVSRALPSKGPDAFFRNGAGVYPERGTPKTHELNFHEVDCFILSISPKVSEREDSSGVGRHLADDKSLANEHR